MPVFRPPRVPSTGLSWIDALMNAMAADPAGGFGPAPMALVGPAGEAAKPLIKAAFLGIQQGLKPGKSFELWNLLQAIPGHPAGSTVSRQTIEGAGYQLPRRTMPEDLLREMRERMVEMVQGVPAPRTPDPNIVRQLEIRNVGLQQTRPGAMGFGPTTEPMSPGVRAAMPKLRSTAVEDLRKELGSELIPTFEQIAAKQGISLDDLLSAINSQPIMSIKID